ncbi:hydantoinase B/oxoprolinase family protein [Pseudooceanicola sediminis]|uniref:Hydantoinase B/oxoprolinase family protein n=1 Tax=Pseudooceanicola sediminis TaxID=2211117 RepID=A0A399IWD9_9RHOB|nr:hydantoinase B/oxoprolinase family protein [Pseudooceanicola sediminis]KAA2312416.1 hydantoinase B/oxoprolinase family protein [Puniceibacterium sp. HSS470]RII37465.1 hydantoinase B/oxoprolinase family protein [Pseudooceanicola sediminis]|tara:strand:+ start:10739 stop:12730 length:1992 start_codon:yes stop_codon:yes gene_type:complete
MSSLDPVLLEILGNKFASVTEEMCLTLQRTGRTLYVKETADFACALAGLDGRFFAYPRSIGVSGFVGLECLPAIQSVIDTQGALQPGDVILTNDPYRSTGLATHLPDLHMIEPYFHEGEIVAYGWCFVHCSDVGGRVASSISPLNTEIFQEGLRIPPVKLMRRGEMSPEIKLFLDANSRTPEANMGDIRAMLASLATGRRRTEQMLRQHGVAELTAAQEALMSYAAGKAEAVLRQMPEGRYSFSDYLDDDAASRLPVRVSVTVEIADGKVHLDFTGTDPQVATAMNIPSCGRPHAWLTLRMLALVQTLDKSAPLNAGLLRPLSVTTPLGTLVNPQEPAATGVRHAAAIRVNDILNGAFGLALPDVLPAAASGTVIPIVMSEPTARGGRMVQVIEPLIGGTGARHGHDGVDGRDSGISNLANNPAETVEAELGVEVLHYALRADSGGAGQWRGGCGMELSFRVLTDGSHVLGRGMERMLFRPWGQAGGQPGQPGSLIVNEGRPREIRLGKIDVLEVNAGDIVTFRTPGAGGWGNPTDRDPMAVLADVAAGFVTPDAARRAYGVVLCDGHLDPEATMALRAEMPTQDGTVFGPERDTWDSIFAPALMDQLNSALLSLPLSRRQTHRRKIFETVLADLPSNFPRSPASDTQRDTAIKRFETCLRSF